jgi:hypothetical protein
VVSSQRAAAQSEDDKTHATREQCGKEGSGGDTHLQEKPTSPATEESVHGDTQPQEHPTVANTDKEESIHEDTQSQEHPTMSAVGETQHATQELAKPPGARALSPTTKAAPSCTLLQGLGGATSLSLGVETGTSLKL